MTAFSNKSTPREKPPQRPTSYQFFKDAAKGVKGTKSPVDTIFAPSGKIQAWGFFTHNMRFNIYQDDERYPECEELVNQAVDNGWTLRVIYAEDERGLATLDIDKKKVANWRKSENAERWYIPNTEF